MNYDEFIKNAYVETELETPVGKIVVSKERNLYNAITKKYRTMATETVDSFMASYKNYTSCQDVIDCCIPDFQLSSQFVLDDIVNTLISKGDYDWDYDSLVVYAEKTGLFDDFKACRNNLIRQVNSIGENLENTKEYREARKDSRGRWVGGTFVGSMMDAIGDQAEIAAMNLATGAIHGLVNMAGNAISEKEAKSKLSILLESDELRNSFINAVYISVLKLSRLFVELVVDKDLEVEGFDDKTEDSENRSKAQRLVNNLNNGMIPEDKISDICKQVLELDPFNDEIYEYLYNKFGDDGNLSALATYFGVIAINVLKEQKAFEFLKENLGETEEEAIKTKERLIEFCNEIHLEVNDELECISVIDNIISKFDLKYRTVAGIECSTREAADFARKEFEEIKKILEEIEPLSGDPLLPYERDLLQKKEYIANNFSSEIVPASIVIMDKHLENFNKAFCDTQVIGTADRTKAAKTRALRYARNVKFESEEEYELEYQKFAEFIEENLGVTIAEAEDARLYLERKKQKIGKESIDFSGIATDVTSSIKDIGAGLKGLFGKKK